MMIKCNIREFYSLVAQIILVVLALFSFSVKGEYIINTMSSWCILIIIILLAIYYSQPCTWKNQYFLSNVSVMIASVLIFTQVIKKDIPTSSMILLGTGAGYFFWCYLNCTVQFIYIIKLRDAPAYYCLLASNGRVLYCNKMIYRLFSNTSITVKNINHVCQLSVDKKTYQSLIRGEENNASIKKNFTTSSGDVFL